MFGYVRGQGAPYFFIFIVMEQKTLEEEILSLCCIFPDLKKQVPINRFVFYLPCHLGKFNVPTNKYRDMTLSQAEETIERYLREFANNQDFHTFIAEMEKMEVKNRKIFFLAIEHMKQK